MHGSFGYDLLARQRNSTSLRHKSEKSLSTNHQTKKNKKTRSKPLPIKVDIPPSSNHSACSTLSSLTPCSLLSPSLSCTPITPSSMPSTPRTLPDSQRHHPRRTRKKSKKSNKTNRPHVTYFLLYTTDHSQCNAL